MTLHSPRGAVRAPHKPWSDALRVMATFHNIEIGCVDGAGEPGVSGDSGAVP